jgi:hypothetical protein
MSSAQIFYKYACYKVLWLPAEKHWITCVNTNGNYPTREIGCHEDENIAKLIAEEHYKGLLRKGFY